MDNAALLEKIKKRFSEAEEVPLPDPKWIRNSELQVKVPSARVAELASYLKNDLGFDLLSFMCAVDWLPQKRFDLVYYFMRSAEPQTKFFVKAELPRTESPHVPSLARIYEGADWQERETYDLYGIHFDGHPNLKRILLWEGYNGYPLRKDYIHILDKYDNGQEIGLPGVGPATTEHKPSDVTAAKPATPPSAKPSPAAPPKPTPPPSGEKK